MFAPPVAKAKATKTPAALVRKALRGPSAPLPADARAFMEPRFGCDLGAVRVHTDGAAAMSARAIRARAYTSGSRVVFGAGQYQPTSAAGRELLAHELAHVVQGRGLAPQPELGPANDVAEAEADRAAHTVSTGTERGIPVTSRPALIRMSPQPSSTEQMHDDLVEQFRAENGYPPHGIDTSTGQHIGPTDSEIRFGGLLDAWLAAKNPATPAAAPGVAAPAQAPTVVPPGTTNVVAACAGAPDVGACRQHQTYIQNILPQAIANIAAVTSPYSAAIAAAYGAALPAARTAAAPTPGGSTVDAAGGPVTVTFGATTHTFTKFTISLQQVMQGANGQALGIGGPVAFVLLNEASGDAITRNIAGIEATMVHEATHLFMDIVEKNNAARAPGTAAVDPNLDRGSYATLKTSLSAALLPFVTQIQQLPSFAKSPPQQTAAKDADFTAGIFLSETLARTEAGIFAKQRGGQAFTVADLPALFAFIHTDAYWSPTPPMAAELTTFLNGQATQIDTAIQPIVVQVGTQYLTLRP